MLSTLGAFLFLREIPSQYGVLGLVAVVVGIGLISTQGSLSAFREPDDLAGVRWGTATGLRFASLGAGASLGLPIIGKLLGHSQAATTHRYAHLDADPMHRAVETIGSTIAAAMERNKS
jgi:integrase